MELWWGLLGDTNVGKRDGVGEVCCRVLLRVLILGNTAVSLDAVARAVAPVPSRGILLGA